MGDISADIKNIIKSELNVGVEMLSDDAHFRSLPNISSVNVLEIILEVERRFGIELDDEVTVKVQTVGQFCDEVDKLLHSNGRLKGNA